MTLVKILHLDNRLSRIICDPSLLGRIRSFFSFRQQRWKNKRRTSYTVYLISASGDFRKGLTGLVTDYLKTNNINYEVKYDYESPLVPVDFEKIWMPTCDMQPYDYQLETVVKSLMRERGLWDLATSAGKSLTACIFIKSFLSHYPGEKVMFIVNDVNLLYQAQKDFISYGVDPEEITLWGDLNRPDFSKNILIVIGKSLISNFEFSHTFTRDRSLLFCDEVDLTANPKTDIHKFIDQHDSKFRFGCTGTIPSDPFHRAKLIANFGEVLFRKSAKELRETGVLTPCEIVPICINHSDISEDMEWAQEFEYICNSVERNELLIQLALSLKNNTLLLVDRISQLESLKSLVESQDHTKQVFFMRGDVDGDDRQDMLSIMEEIDNAVVISIAKLFSRGVSVKNIHNIVCSTLGKKDSNVIQTIGRGMRKHHLKYKVSIIDIHDNLEYSKRHWNERIEIYASEDIPILETKDIDL
jgi:superfamily II DNA or RNA helicase